MAGYKWIALSNTTLGMLMASLDINMVLISVPAIFRGININPLAPDETTYLLWMLMGPTGALFAAFLGYNPQGNSRPRYWPKRRRSPGTWSWARNSSLQ